MLNKRVLFLLVALPIFGARQDLFGQCTNACPPGGTDSAVGVGLSAFLINPDGSTGPAIGGNNVGSCQKIRLRMSISYVPTGPSGGASVAFSGGRMVIRTGDGVFSQDVTPVGGVPIIAPLSEIGMGGCAQGGTNFFLSDFTTDFDISTHQAEIVGGKISFQALYGPAGTVAYFCPPILDQTAGQTPIQVNVVPPPKIDITKHCLAATNSSGGAVLVTYSGTVSNSGTSTLTNIAVVNNKPVPNTPVFSIPSLLSGQSVTFTNTYSTTSNLCGPFTDVLTVSAQDLFTCPVSNSSTDTCVIVYSPAIQVTKFCPNTPVQPGGVLTFSGTVSNAGNAVLTNVVVFNDKPAPGTMLIGPLTLGLGQSMNFTNSYSVPLDSCGPYVDTLTAIGTSICGVNVTNSNTAICPGTNTPSLAVTKSCPQVLLQPGQTNVITGTVTNTGNITLTNVTVTNVIAAIGATRQILGPLTLAPGAGTTFTDSYVIPLDSCGPYVDTVIGAGSDKCFGNRVTNSFTASCPGTNSPAIAVTKSCPPGLLQPGQTNFITGTVTNTGNITLTNVMVTNLITVLGTSHFVLGPVTLAPGAGTTFSDSYVIPLDSCGPYPDTVVASGSDKCFGRLVTNSFTVACPGTNSPSIAVTKSCPPGLLQPGQTNVITGTVTNTGNITLTNVVVTNLISVLGTSHFVLGPVTLAPGAGTTFADSYIIPLDSCGPYADTVIAAGSDKCFGRVVTNSFSVACPGTNAPAITVTKSCPPVLLQPGQTNNITGTVTNTGNITLTNVMVTNVITVLGTTHFVFGPVTLAPGAGATFNDSYVIPLDSCGPYPDTVIAVANDKCFGRKVTNSFTALCPGTNSPSIAVTKSCPANPVPPGGTLVITGFVTNTGNITLTNITVTNVIAAIGQSHFVLGPISLPPGGVAAFSDQYTTPLDSCGPYRDTVLASGADKCFGRIVIASAFKDCPGITTPRIVVIKHCPANPVPPGGLAVFSGTVSNAGNITLTNVVVVNDRPTNNTPVFGPITLAPGQSMSFTGSELVPSNCCSYFDTLLATGTSICTGSNVVSSSTAVCPTLTIPRIAVTKNCPANPVPLGQPLVFTGTVSNAGNITLIGVTVVDSKPTNNTPVLGPITLAPGESANFAGSYLVPINTCDSNIADTVTAFGTDVCAGSNVTSIAAVVCPIIPTPRLAVTKKCPPNPVAPGDLLVYTGTVSNSGNITITNIIVVDDRPVPNTPILGPIILTPGQSVSFSGSYIAPYDCCGPCVDTVTARGNEFCAGSNVVADASAACPRITTPRIAVTRDCPLPPAREGDLVFFTGSVSNSGNATLGNVSVVDSQAGVVLANIALAPGESMPFVGMYIPTNCGPNVSSSIVASGSDVCTGVLASNTFILSCSIGCPPVRTVTIFGPKVSVGFFQFSFDTDSGPTYTVQFTDLLLPVNWMTLTNFPGDGNVATIHDAITTNHKFYRVLAQ